jgi:hypothetical protein
MQPHACALHAVRPPCRTTQTARIRTHTATAHAHLHGHHPTATTTTTAPPRTRLGLVEPTWEEVNGDDPSPKVFDEFFSMDPDGEFGMVSCPP